MQTVTKINVLYKGNSVGSIIRHQKYQTVFAYERSWLAHGFSISPFSLPLRPGPFIAKMEPFDGLFGVFADSMPDGWGRLLVDRLLLKNHIAPQSIGSLERLAIVGAAGMGALTYEPEFKLSDKAQPYDLDKLAEECQNILATNYSENIDELFALGGSSGGARPKILTAIGGEDWIIKFPASTDKNTIGKQEYDYAQCAKACGIEMSATKLFPSKKCPGYFGTKRFDRELTAHGLEPIHMLSASALLETSHRIPNLDYITLGKLTMALTHDYTELEKLYRLMCFNVFAHNRDDHSKNFTYLYLEQEKRWVLSPAYDLTYSYSLGGEHATTVNGNGANPSLTDILAVAKAIGINNKAAKSIPQEVNSTVKAMLKEYL